MSVDDEPGASSTNFTAADIPIGPSEMIDTGDFPDVLSYLEHFEVLPSLGFSAAANVPAIDTPSGDAETTCNAIISAMIAAGLMEFES